MLKMKKMVMIVMAILTVCLLFAMSFEVKATGTTDDPITLDGIDITTDDSNTSTEQDTNAITANEIAANSQATQVIQPETNTVANNVGNTLPQTGVTEDITVMFFIIVCVVSAIYAYRKIKNYNV